MADSILLGSLYLQMYQAYYVYDYSKDQQVVELAISKTCSLNNVYIGSASYSAGTNPFYYSTTHKDLGWWIAGTALGLIGIGVLIYFYCRKNDDDEDNRNDLDFKKDKTAE